MRKNIRQSERGFTLVELMVATAISMIVIGGIFGVMINQQTTYLAQMELAEASQNARASLDIIKQSFRTAGWGFVAKETALGLPAVGTCYATNVTDQSNCNDLVANNANGSVITSDRLRISGMQPGQTFSRKTAWGTSATKIKVTDLTRERLAVDDLAILSGQCTGGTNNGKIYTGVVKITAVSASADVNYDFNAGVSGYPAFDCTSMTSGFAFGKANIVEFYIDRYLTNPDPGPGATNVPRLMMLTNRGGRDPFTNAAPIEQTVAYDIETMQVRYGLDCGVVPATGFCSGATSANPDDVVDSIASGQQYCNDLTAANCNTGKSVIENQMRVMAVQIAVVPRTRNMIRRRGNATVNGAAISLFGSTLPADAYRHWIYRATIALRNNQLPIITP